MQTDELQILPSFGAGKDFARRLFRHAVLNAKTEFGIGNAGGHIAMRVSINVGREAEQELELGSWRLEVGNFVEIIYHKMRDVIVEGGTDFGGRVLVAMNVNRLRVKSRALGNDHFGFGSNVQPKPHFAINTGEKWRKIGFRGIKDGHTLPARAKGMNSACSLLTQRDFIVHIERCAKLLREFIHITTANFKMPGCGTVRCERK